MPHDPIAELAGLAASVAPARAALLERARAVGALFNVEVVDVRPPGADGVWDLRVRPLPGRAEAHRPEPESALPRDSRIPAGPPDPPFASPVRGSRPFDVDGTHDVLRLVEEADPVVRVPPRGSAGAPLPRLTEEARIRMLPATIAGDALLSLQHQALHRDPAAVEAALRQGRERFAAEVARAGMDARADELLALYDTAAATARRQLLGEV
ncbi:MAG TPA: hypothetical protein VF746_24440 [Longimicrobium sp.]|jgi:hypothetical protein